MQTFSAITMGVGEELPQLKRYLGAHILQRKRYFVFRPGQFLPLGITYLCSSCFVIRVRAFHSKNERRHEKTLLREKMISYRVFNIVRERMLDLWLWLSECHALKAFIIDRQTLTRPLIFTSNVKMPTFIFIF